MNLHIGLANVIIPLGDLEMEEKFNIISFLKKAVAMGASDEHLRVGHAPYIRKDGGIWKVNHPALTEDDLKDALAVIIPASLRDAQQSTKDLDFIFEIKGCSRFRVNYSQQLAKPALVLRNIPYSIPTIEELELPNAIKQFAKLNNGIVLVTGPTGSGKSSTLAALIDIINSECQKHIVTLEDPIEFIFANKKSIVSQRQIGIDTKDFPAGLKYVLRQDPDIILIGEIRNEETMLAALKAAETGHLVFATLHTNDAVQTINRIVNMFDQSSRDLIRRQIADSLRGTVAQKLIFSEKHKKRFPACEIMVVTPTVQDYIVKDRLEEIYNCLREGSYDEMMTLNASLAELVNQEKISETEAYSVSEDENELAKIIKGSFTGTKNYYE